MPSDFHLKNRRYVLFTYSQAGPDFDYWAVVDLLGDLGAECIIGREEHADGGIHFHVFTDFGRLFSTRKVRVFDVGGKHPNIQPIGRTPAKAYDYAIKDGDVVAGGLGRPGGDCDWDPDNFWSSAAHCGSADEFLHFCDQLAPRDLIRSFPNFRAYANWKWDTGVPEYSQPVGAVFDTTAAPGIDEWLRKSLVLFGPYGCGKTVWARSLNTHIYFGSQWSGKVAFQGIESAEYAIFDDWKGGLKGLPGYKDWFGAQWHVSMRQLHHDARLVEWGRPIIWLCNRDPRILSHERDEIDWEWMERACDFVEVTGLLTTFRASTE
ncbi:replication-associated protein [Pteropus associated gemycircularvirus 6]|uniref:Replication-associated protein n=1 Tax=Pteropus associated gemycircularvirus 6 TaxID=1985400 RepID=A0A140CTP2_9VIRU|nr:replication-associated protein [Pteropus associated gemycircularvirus 6]AMH87699.1 replication-associated protein [Pteropus associated gemycircularvirus 6]